MTWQRKSAGGPSNLPVNPLVLDFAISPRIAWLSRKQNSTFKNKKKILQQPHVTLLPESMPIQSFSCILSSSGLYTSAMKQVGWQSEKIAFLARHNLGIPNEIQYQKKTIECSHVVRVQFDSVTVVSLSHLHLIEASLSVANLSIPKKNLCY